MDPRIDAQSFHEFQSKIASRVAAGPTCRRFLEAFGAPDVTAETAAAIVRGNQYLEHLLLREIRSLGLKDNTPSLRAAIALLGMSRLRDLVCSVSIVRSVGAWHPAVGKDGRLALRPAELLKHALKAEAVALAQGEPDTELAFCAGLLFDVLAAVGNEVFAGPRGFAELVAETFKRGLRVARLGLALGGPAGVARLPRYSRQLFAACLVHDVGRLAMELLYPAGQARAYAGFRKHIADAQVSRTVAHVLERRQFGLSHESYGAQLVSCFPRLAGCESAVLFQHEPYLLRDSRPELWRFAAYVALAANMASADRDPLSRELDGLAIEPGRLIPVMEKARSSGD